MLWLRDILAAHQLLLALFQGQAFFVLGLSIVFLARRSARLAVARGLPSLAVFGFCEALVAWSLGWFLLWEEWPPWLAWSRVFLLAVGFISLSIFALQTLFSLKERPWMRWVFGSGLLALWLIGLVTTHLIGAPSEQTRLAAEITARYILALPGGLVSAWGLRRQTYRTIEPERLPQVKPYLRITYIALGAFAFFGGLIGPAAVSFPAKWINRDTFLQMTGVPVSLPLGLCGLAMTYGIVRALGEVLGEMELWLESVERMQALASERERIGRELHDGIIQSIYAAGLMLEGAQHSIPDEPEAANAQLTRAIESLNRTIKDIRRYIFDLRGEMLNDDLEIGLRKMLKDFRVNTLLETEFIVEGTNTRLLRTEDRQHIFQIAREGLTNVARHARARRVQVRLRYGTSAMKLCISDDGIGLSALPINKGQGLRNIRERARLLDGMLDIDTTPDEGMTLILTVPYQDNA